MVAMCVTMAKVGGILWACSHFRTHLIVCLPCKFLINTHTRTAETHTNKYLLGA